MSATSADRFDVVAYSSPDGRPRASSPHLPNNRRHRSRPDSGCARRTLRQLRRRHRRSPATRRPSLHRPWRRWRDRHGAALRRPADRPPRRRWDSPVVGELCVDALAIPAALATDAAIEARGLTTTSPSTSGLPTVNRLATPSTGSFTSRSQPDTGGTTSSRHERTSASSGRRTR